jgi:uncharacterized oxidoreductase
LKTSGHTILITGGTSEIGLAFAEKFLQSGNTVIICGRRKERLQEIQKKHKDIVTIESDLSVTTGRQNLADWVLKNHPQTNILINNAGIQLVADLTKPVDLERIRGEVETNFIAPLHLISLLTSHLKTKEEAAIINISSGLAFTPIAFMPVYCATKAAIHSLTLSVRHQLKNTSVKVFEIAPPAVDTELGHDRRQDKTQTHGGIPVSDFIEDAMQAIQHDVLETAVGQAKGLREKRESLFEMLNK